MSTQQHVDQVDGVTQVVEGKPDGLARYPGGFHLTDKPGGLARQPGGFHLTGKPGGLARHPGGFHLTGKPDGLVAEMKTMHEDTSNDDDEHVVEHCQHQQLQPRVVEVTQVSQR